MQHPICKEIISTNLTHMPDLSAAGCRAGHREAPEVRTVGYARVVPAHLEGWAPLPLLTHPGACPCLWIRTDPSLAFSLPICPLSLSAPSSVPQPGRALTYLLHGEPQGLA